MSAVYAWVVANKLLIGMLVWVLGDFVLGELEKLKPNSVPALVISLMKLGLNSLKKADPLLAGKPDEQ